MPYATPHRTVLCVAIVLACLACANPAHAQAMDIEQVCAGLRSPVASNRITAFQQLAKMEAQREAIEPMMAALADPSPAVRCEALKTWGLVGAAVDRLVRYTRPERHTLPQGGDTVEMSAWQGWQKQLLASIEVNLASPSAALQSAALHSLGHLYEPVEYVCPPRPQGCIMPTPGIGLDDKVAAILVRFAERHPSAFVAMARETDPQVVYCSTSTLVAIKHPGVSTMLTLFLRDPDPMWRMIACNGLSKSGNVNSLLVPLLGDPDDRVRLTVLHNLRQHEKVLATLVHSFSTSPTPLKRSILLLMKYTRWQEDSVIAAVLGDAYDDVDGDIIADALDVRHEILMVWDRFDKKLTRLDIRRLLHHSYPRVRAEAARLLYYYRSTENFGLLLPMLRDPDTAVREVAIGMLEDEIDPRLPSELIAAYRLGAEKRSYDLPDSLVKNWRYSEPLVRRLVNDPDSRMRALAVKTLGRKKITSYIPWLAGAARDTSTEVREAAAWAALEWTEALPGIAVLLEDKDPKVRRSAMEIFTRTDAVLARESLLALMQNPDKALASDATQYLEELEGREEARISREQRDATGQ